MAKRKKAKRASAKTVSKRTKAASISPPAGYKVMDVGGGNFAPTHDFEAEPVLEGTIESVRKSVKIPGQKRPSSIINVRVKGGNVRAVWSSKALEPLFEKARKGMRVWIRFDGYAARTQKGRNPMKLYTVATG